MEVISAPVSVDYIVTISFTQPELDFNAEVSKSARLQMSEPKVIFDDLAEN